jgi:hypothetical protein
MGALPDASTNARSLGFEQVMGYLRPSRRAAEAALSHQGYDNPISARARGRRTIGLFQLDALSSRELLITAEAGKRYAVDIESQKVHTIE